MYSSVLFCEKNYFKKGKRKRLNKKRKARQQARNKARATKKKKVNCSNYISTFDRKLKFLSTKTESIFLANNLENENMSQKMM